MRGSTVEDIPGESVDHVGAWAKNFTLAALAVELSGKPNNRWPVLPWVVKGSRVFAFCLVEVRLRGVAAFLRRIRPLTAEAGPASDIAIVDEHKEPHWRAFRNLSRGIELLRQFERESIGRPVGSGDFPDREEFETLIIAIVEELACKREKYGQEQVARYLNAKRPYSPHRDGGTDARQLRAWIADHHLSWPTMKAEGVRRAKQKR